MISGQNVYDVVSALAPLYAAMVLAYGSVQWWGVFTPIQCAGINRYVAMFAVPVLSYQVIASSNLFTLDYRFIAADTLQKVVILIVLGVLSLIVSARPIGGGRYGPEWSITLFSLSSLPNTLIVGIPLLRAMYGDHAANLMVQVVVFQSVVWYNLLLVLFEYRAAKILINERFPGSVRAITSIKVDSDVMSLSGIDPLETEAERDADGRIRVRVRRSPYASSNNDSFRMSSLRSATPRASNLSGVEIYSVQSSLSRSMSSFNYANRDVVSVIPVNPTYLRSGSQGLPMSGLKNETDMPSYNMGLAAGREAGHLRAASNASVGSEPRALPGHHKNNIGSFGGSGDYRSHDSSRFEAHQPELFEPKGRSYLIDKSEERSHYEGSVKGSRKVADGGEDVEVGEGALPEQMKPERPPVMVMVKLIILMVWRKLIRNPNTYASLLGVAWSLISNKLHVKMPKIIQGCITIVANTGLGMAVFSLGLFTALQPKIIACGKRAALMSMVMKFLLGPAVTAATTLAVGIRGKLLHISIIQAALPLGVVPFVFAKEYDLHPDIISTSVIFGMVVALPVTIIYNILLEL